MSDFENAAQALVKQAEPLLRAAEALAAAHAAQQAAVEAGQRQLAAVAAAEAADEVVAAAKRRLAEIEATQDKAVAEFKANAAARKAALGVSLDAEHRKRTDAIKADCARLEEEKRELESKLPGLKAEVVALGTERDRLQKAVDTLRSTIKGV